MHLKVGEGSQIASNDVF